MMTKSLEKKNMKNLFYADKGKNSPSATREKLLKSFLNVKNLFKHECC